jgi:hypothetical protein
MKKIVLLIFMFSTLILYLDDALSSQNSISDFWNLILVSWECEVPISEKETHVWDFDLSTNLVTLLNRIDEDLQILESGRYLFSHTLNTLKIEAVSHTYYFENETLFLSNNAENF